MANISKLIPGQILYDKHKYRQGNTRSTAWGLWQVEVIEVHAEDGYIIASWNGNNPVKMSQARVEKLKVKKPDIPNKRW